MAATCDTTTFSSAHGLTFEEDEITKLGLMPTLVMMDRPRHTLYRRLVNAMFTPRAVSEREQRRASLHEDLRGAHRRYG